LGYVSIDELKKETLPVGVIQIDAIFSPVKKVNFVVEDMRVGGRTDYNKVRFVIETDGGISPKDALAESLGILETHFSTALATLTGVEAKAEKTEEAEDEVVEEPKEEKEEKEVEEKPKKKATKKEKK